MTPLCIELVKGVFTLLAVALGSWIALLAYFRQKEYELAKQRYLEQAVDVIAAQVQSVLGVVSHNYARCLQVAREFRDSKEKYDVGELERGFLALETVDFQQIAHHRIGTLLGSDVVWTVYQLALAYATTTNARIVNEMPQAIRAKLTSNQIKKSHEEVAEYLRNDLERVQQEGFRYAALIQELHNLGNMLESNRLSLKAIASFHNRTETKALVERLRSAFKDEMSSEQLSAEA